MRSQLPCITLFFLPVILSAQVAGPFHPASLHNESLAGSSQQWINTGNAAQSDNQYASFGDIPDKTGSYTDYLVATNFGFTLPQGATILGIVVEIERSDPNGITADYSIRIVRDGQIGQEQFASETAYPAQDIYQAYGGSTNLWGESWDSKQIDNNNFGVAISAQRTADDGITAGRIDDIRIIVYFSTITLPLLLTEFTAIKKDQFVLLHWKTVQESGMEKFKVERSSDGTAFQSITEMQALNQPAAEYSWSDADPLRGISYYRLAIVETSGLEIYSKIISVIMDKTKQFFLYPSPWNKELQLTINNTKNERLTIWFINEGGQILSTAITESSLVPTQTLVNRKGVIYYKIYDSMKNFAGSGRIIVQ